MFRSFRTLLPILLSSHMIHIFSQQSVRHSKPLLLFGAELMRQQKSSFQMTVLLRANTGEALAILGSSAHQIHVLWTHAVIYSDVVSNRVRGRERESARVTPNRLLIYRTTNHTLKECVVSATLYTLSTVDSGLGFHCFRCNQVMKNENPFRLHNCHKIRVQRM